MLKLNELSNNENMKWPMMHAAEWINPSLSDKSCISSYSCLEQVNYNQILKMFINMKVVLTERRTHTNTHTQRQRERKVSLLKKIFFSWCLHRWLGYEGPRTTVNCVRPLLPKFIFLSPVSRETSKDSIGIG